MCRLLKSDWHLSGKITTGGKWRREPQEKRFVIRLQLQVRVGKDQVVLLDRVLNSQVSLLKVHQRQSAFRRCQHIGRPIESGD